MYRGNVKQVEEFHSLILQSIRDIGVKHGFKKNYFSKSNQDSRCINKDKRIFKKPLCNLKTQFVTLKSGVAVEVPLFVVETCCYIKHRCDVEGIFRKAGSAPRLREIKAIVDCGKQLDPQHHVVDVSNILTLFFRELPDPLIPYSFHDLLLRCLLVKDKAVDGVLLTCLMFSSVHLNTLAYLMEFFREVANNEEANKMGISNLTRVITPSLMPVERKIIVNADARLEHHMRVIEILLHNTDKIGFLPDPIIEKALTIGCILPNNEEAEINENEGLKTKKKKKRRSGSLTRMINGLKKIVGKGSPEASEHPLTSTPDFSSPCVKSAKKRKLQESSGAFSNKKKREILKSLPQCAALADVPCTPLPAVIAELHYTPRVHSHPNPCGKSLSPVRKQKHKKFFPSSQANETNNVLPASKSESRLKSRLSVGRKSGKKVKKTGHAASVDQSSPTSSCRSVKEHRTSSDWQWKSSLWRRKKFLSSSDTSECTEDLKTKSRSSDSLFCSDSTSYTTSILDAGVDLSGSVSSFDTEFVKIPKSEYEEIKNRVSAIENRISHEFGFIASDPNSLENVPSVDETEDEMCVTEKVQNAYEKTIEESEKLRDPVTTDQLAKRLSRELKIRHSFENKVIRSPSARKIGTIRRRSRENARTSLNKISKTNSKHVVNQASVKQDCPSHAVHDEMFYPKSNLRRGRPNTVYSGLPHPSPLRVPVSLANIENSPASFTLSYSSVSSDKPISCQKLEQVTNSSEAVVCRESTKSSQKYLISERSSFENTSSQCEVRRASSFHGTDLLHNTSDKFSCDIRKSHSQMDVAFSKPNIGKPLIARNESSADTECWKNAPQFFTKENVQNVPVSGRESVVKIRSQNAGMVLSRMRLFDKKQDPNRTPSRLAYIQSQTEKKPTSKSFMLTHDNGQSLRIQCIQDNFLEKLNSQDTSAGRRLSVRLNPTVNNLAGQTVVLKGSPKKIGSPRKKYRSPKHVNKKNNTKSSKSPQRERITPHSENKFNIKKFNSLRETSSKSPLTSKVNLTAPASVLSCGKENMSSTHNFRVSPMAKLNNENGDTKPEILQQILLPQNLKETIYDVCTPTVEKLSKMSMSPLKDCNRIDVNAAQFESNRPNIYKTPKTTPYIKAPLLVKSPAEYTRTPYCQTPAHRSHRVATPLRALPNLNAITPVLPQCQQTPLQFPSKCRKISKY